VKPLTFGFTRCSYYEAVAWTPLQSRTSFVGDLGSVDTP
jgi:hypothetical protein